jgi:predicted GNAT superfamily acetyltransferase
MGNNIHEGFEPKLTNGHLTEHLAHLPVGLIEDTQGVMELTDGEDIYTLALIAKTGWIWGARDNGKLVGAVEFVQNKDPKKGFIHGVVVDPEDQYHGLGTRLVMHTMQEAFNHGITKIEATIAPTNGPSLRVFLNNCGYHASGFYPDFYGEGEHRLWVERDLGVSVVKFDYEEMLDRQTSNPSIIFVEHDNYGEIQTLLEPKDLAVVGVVKTSESHAPMKNLLCIAPQSEMQLL